MAWLIFYSVVFGGLTAWVAFICRMANIGGERPQNWLRRMFRDRYFPTTDMTPEEREKYFEVQHRKAVIDAIYTSGALTRASIRHAAGSTAPWPYSIKK
jgi:hypothetical protein